MSEKTELLETIADIEEIYEDLIARVRDLQTDLRLANDPAANHLARRMDSYTIPWLEAFLEQTTQPGSIADIKEDVEKLDDETDEEEDEEDEGGEYDNREPGN